MSKKSILIIDGVNNAIPQLTTYRVDNKAEQLRSLGFKVATIPLKKFKLHMIENVSHIIIYRAPYSKKLRHLCILAEKQQKTILYDIDDLVIDTVYTNQLDYTKNLSKINKIRYNWNVLSYKKMMLKCQGVIVSTSALKNEIEKYHLPVLLNRNLANQELVELSQAAHEKALTKKENLKIGYFSGSITHNENFELIKMTLLKLMKKYPNISLVIMGHLDVPAEFYEVENQIIIYPYVTWKELPNYIAEVDINLAPLVASLFNQAKSEIKWIEASLVKVPTVSSDIGAFTENIIPNKTGILVDDDSWESELEKLIANPKYRKMIAENAYHYVLKHNITIGHCDDLTDYIEEKRRDDNL